MSHDAELIPLPAHAVVHRAVKSRLQAGNGAGEHTLRTSDFGLRTSDFGFRISAVIPLTAQ
jgi:hypothetical protein